MARKPDHVILVITATALPDSPTDRSEHDTTADNLARFLYEQRTNWPGAAMDTVALARELVELGARKFQIKDVKGGKKALSFRIVPRLVKRLSDRLIEKLGKVNMATLAAGTKSALRSGARGTVISFFVVGAIDVVHELAQDERSMRRLGIDLAMDTLKLLASFFIATLTGGALVAMSAPGAVVIGVGLALGVLAGWGLDRLDSYLEVTQGLQDAAEELQREGEWALQRFLYQLEQWILSRYRLPTY